jgi:hypothetical protein
MAVSALLLAGLLLAGHLLWLPSARKFQTPAQRLSPPLFPLRTGRSVLFHRPLPLA